MSKQILNADFALFDILLLYFKNLANEIFFYIGT